MPSSIIRNPARPDDNFKAQQELEFDQWRVAIAIVACGDACPSDFKSCWEVKFRAVDFRQSRKRLYIKKKENDYATWRQV